MKFKTSFKRKLETFFNLKLILKSLRIISKNFRKYYWELMNKFEGNFSIFKFLNFYKSEEIQENNRNYSYINLIEIQKFNKIIESCDNIHIWIF